MFTKAWAILKGIGTALNIIRWFQEDSDRKDQRKAGRNEQKVEDLKARESQASEANAIDEDVRGLSDDALDRELRNGS